MANRASVEKNRAEEIRARRQERQTAPQTQPFGNSASRKQSTQRVPLTRRPTATQPVVNRAKNRRQVPLKTKGAELHLPALPNLQIGWRLISGAVFALSLAVVFTFSSLSTFKVTTVTLEGAERLTNDAILSQLGLSGTSIIKIDPDKVETLMLERFPSLSSAKVSAGLPADLTITVKERQPLIAWQQASGTLWIDQEGVMFVPRGETEVPLTIIAASDPPEAARSVEETLSDPEVTEEDRAEVLPGLPRTTPEFVQGVLTLVGQVPSGAYLQYDPQFGLGWRDPNGWLVYFGKDAAELDLKLAEYQMLIAEIQKNNLTPSLISLEFLHAPFYRLEQ